MALEITKRNITKLEPGDMVEFKKGVYSHWAIYKGHEEVVHLAGTNDGHMASNPQHSFTISGKLFNKAEVVIDNIWKVADGYKMYKKNYLDSSSSPLSRPEILRRAMSRIGPVTYNLIVSNCEHFATWCRYGDGKEKSQQVNNVLIGAAMGAAMGVAAVGGLGVAVGAAAVGVGVAVVEEIAYMSSGSRKKDKQ